MADLVVMRLGKRNKPPSRQGKTGNQEGENPGRKAGA